MEKTMGLNSAWEHHAWKCDRENSDWWWHQIKILISGC